MKLTDLKNTEKDTDKLMLEKKKSHKHSHRKHENLPTLQSDN